MRDFDVAQSITHCVHHDAPAAPTGMAGDYGMAGMAVVSQDDGIALMPWTDKQTRLFHAAANSESGIGGISPEQARELLSHDEADESKLPPYMRSITTDISTAKKHAGGVIHIAPDGDILLLHRARDEKNFGGHFSLPGGGIEEGEDPAFGVRRESVEEMGTDAPDGKRYLFDQSMTPTGMAFHTYVQPVTDKFAPKLNGEHSGYTWAPPYALPQPMHPAVAKTIRDRLGVTADMKPEQWEAMRDGFLTWISEEEAEAEHAQDQDIELSTPTFIRLLEWAREKAKGDVPLHEVAERISKTPGRIGMEDYNTLMAGMNGDERKAIIGDEKENQDFKVRQAHDALPLALDRDSVRVIDDSGRLHVSKTNLCKACVSPYFGHEIPDAEALGLEPNRTYYLLRDPAELQKAVRTMDRVPLLRKHKASSADDHPTTETVGAIGSDAEWVDPYVRGSMTIWTGDDIEKVIENKKRQLSPGYAYRADMTPGIFHGNRYDGVMRDIRFNHVALVEDGRQGPDIIVGDEKPEGIEKDITMDAKLKAALARQNTIGALVSYIRPQLAMDEKTKARVPFAVAPLLNGITGKKLASDHAKITGSIAEALKGKLAKDDGVSGLAKLIEACGAQEASNDEEIEPEAQAGMEASAAALPEMVVPPPATDADEHAAIKEFLKSKGMGDADIQAACDMIPKGGKSALDEDDDDDTEIEIEVKDPDKENGMDKKAMDAAIGTAVDTAVKAEREKQQAIRIAFDEVRPYVGELSPRLALDSAEAVYRHVLVNMLGVSDAKDVHGSALPALLKMQPRAGAKPAPEIIAHDEAQVSDFTKMFPGAGLIRAA